MNTAWFRWNCNGTIKEDPLGIKVIEGSEQPTNKAAAHSLHDEFVTLMGVRRRHRDRIRACRDQRD